jgi:hypothetical protein
LGEYEKAPREEQTTKRADDRSQWLALFESLLDLDINEMSPVEAITRLYEMQQRAKEINE